MRPKPLISVRPPAADRESVHPGKGDSRLEAIIDGLSKTTGTCSRFFHRLFSAKFLVYV